MATICVEARNQQAAQKVKYLSKDTTLISVVIITRVCEC